MHETRSGEPRVSPLLFWREGNRIVLIASQGGAAKNPMWYPNLKAKPKVSVHIKAGRRWLSMYAASFDDYQFWTDRVIPVVICDPK